ncbi:MAG: hypothetical protein WEC83_00595 [Patescibacteria group bacterium]
MKASLADRRFAWLVVIVLWATAYLAQLHYDTWRRYAPAKISVSYNEFIEPQPLTGDSARLASFGQSEFLANLYWLQLIQYYGGGTPNGQYRKLPELFSTITDLAPRFQQAYVTGLLILPGEGHVSAAIALGEKGQQALPNAWELPYYTGLVYHIYQKDFAAAADAFARAAELPDAPPIAKLFAGIYFKEANQRQTAYLIFQTIIATSDNEFVRDRAAKYLQHLDGLMLLEKAVADFHSRFNRYPTALAELVSSRIIAELPKSPVAVGYGYDPTSGAVTELAD